MSYRETNRDPEVEELRKRLREVEGELARARWWGDWRRKLYDFNRRRVWDHLGNLAFAALIASIAGAGLGVLIRRDNSIYDEMESRATVVAVEELQSSRVELVCEKTHPGLRLLCVVHGPPRVVGVRCSGGAPVGCEIVRFRGPSIPGSAQGSPPVP